MWSSLVIDQLSKMIYIAPYGPKIQWLFRSLNVICIRHLSDHDIASGKSKYCCLSKGIVKTSLEEASIVRSAYFIKNEMKILKLKHSTIYKLYDAL